jgi:hypothetical protein
MNVDQCRGTVFLHEPLRRSIANMVARRRGCIDATLALEAGHPGEHVGVPDATGRTRFRWDELGFHFGSAEGPDHGPGEGSFGSRPEADVAGTFAAAPRTSTRRPKSGRHAIDANATADEPNRRSPTQALWALTAAIERLTDLISAASDRPNSNDRDASAPGAHDGGSADVASHFL